MAYKEKSIPLTKIVLDSDNPRHNYIESQVEIIEWMTSGHGLIGRKLFSLAKDIVEFGLNPAEKAMVVENDSEPDTFIVIEGNRRIAALKLLNNPDFAPTESWKKKYLKLRPKGYIPLKDVPSVVFDTREEADHFIEIKHLGEAGGAGVVPWDAIQKARHEEQRTGKARYKDALDVLSFVQDSELFHDTTREAASDDSFPITTLQRLLGDKDFRDFIGFDKDSEGNIVFRIDPEEIAKPLEKIIQDFGSGQHNVRDVINKEKRDEYLKEFTPDQVPDHSKQLNKPNLVSSQSITQKTAHPKRVKAKYTDPKNREKVIIKGFQISIDANQYNRARRLFEELKDLPLRKRDGKPIYPNAAILLIRTFIEISVDTYINKKNLPSPNPKGWKELSLDTRIRAVLDDLSNSKLMNAQETKVVTKVLGDPKKMAHPNSIHDMIHNLNQLPIPHDIIDIWDTYSLFLQRLWGAM